MFAASLGRGLPGLIAVPTLQLALPTAAEREACSAAAPSVPALQNVNVIGVTLFGEKHKQTWSPLPLRTEEKKEKKKTKKRKIVQKSSTYSPPGTSQRQELLRGFALGSPRATKRSSKLKAAGEVAKSPPCWGEELPMADANPSWHLHQHHLGGKLQKYYQRGLSALIHIWLQ